MSTTPPSRLKRLPPARAAAATPSPQAALPRQRGSAQATAQALRAAAHRVFVAKGYARATVKDIVDEAGVSRGAFYLHFRDTDDAFAKVISDVIDELIVASRSFSGHTLRERVRAGNRRFLEAFAERRAILRTLFEATYVNAEIGALHLRMRTISIAGIRKHLAQHQRLGHCLPIDLDAAALSLGMMIEGVAQVWLVAGFEPFEQPVRLEPLVDQLTDIWCRGVYADPDLPLPQAGAEHPSPKPPRGRRART